MRADSRLLKVVLTKLWSLGLYSVSSDGGVGRMEAFEVRFPIADVGETGDGLPVRSLGNSAVVGDSGKLVKYRTMSVFCKSALTRRRNGMLSCGRRSCIGLALRGASNVTKPRHTFRATQFFFNHGCSHKSSALGRIEGSLWKHCSRKSCSSSEDPSGIDGISSSTMRNITKHRTSLMRRGRQGNGKGLTGHTIAYLSIGRSPGQQFNHGTS